MRTSSKLNFPNVPIYLIERSHRADLDVPSKILQGHSKDVPRENQACCSQDIGLHPRRRPHRGLPSIGRSNGLDIPTQLSRRLRRLPDRSRPLMMGKAGHRGSAISLQGWRRHRLAT